MLGPVGRQSGPSRRRRRWWPFLLGALVLSLIIGEVSYQVVSSSSGAAQRSSKSWVAAVGPLVEESNALVPTLVQVRTRAAEFRRTHLEELLGQLVQGTQEVRQQLSALALAPPTAAAGSALATVMRQRAQASSALAAAVTLAISASGPASVATAASELQDAATRLSLADQEYLRFLRLLPSGTGASRLPRSVWLLRPASWQPTVLAGWVGLLRHAPALDGRQALTLLAVSLHPRVLEIHGLPTTTTTLPPAPTTTTTLTATASTTPLAGKKTPSRASTSTSSSTTTSTTASTTTTLQIPPPGSVSVVPSTGRIVVTAVVASTGNLPVRRAVLDASLEPLAVSGPSGALEAPAETSGRLGTLVPGATRYLALPAMKVQPGGAYRLVVTATYPGGEPATATIRLTVEP